MNSITIIGDLMLGRNNIQVIKDFGLKKLLQPVRDLVGDSYIIANLECVLTDEKPLDKIKHPLVAPPEFAKELREAGITAVSLANNHIRDCGDNGSFDTAQNLDKNGILDFGLDEFPVIKKVNNKKFCFISFTYPYMYKYPLETLRYVTWAKDEGDYLIVMIHTGVELFQYPLPRDQKVCRDIIDSGADLVVGSHSHCVQSIEYYKGKYIFYGIGDYLFDAWHPSVWKSFYSDEAHPKKFGINRKQEMAEDSLIININSNFNINLYFVKGYITKKIKKINKYLKKPYINNWLDFNDVTEERNRIEGLLIQDLKERNLI